MTDAPQWGSKAWKTHMRRSLAQLKRHGRDIPDIEAELRYIEQKGPVKRTIPSPKTTSNKSKIVSNKINGTTKKIVRSDTSKDRQIVQSPSPITTVANEDGMYGPAKIIKTAAHVPSMPDENGFFGAPVVLKGR